MNNYDIAIIGAGPAGIAASIQLARYGINFIVIEKGPIGGLLNNANLIENYPGFPIGISGPELITIFEKQLERHRIKPLNEEVLAVEHKDNGFNIKTNKDIYTSNILIMATGTSPRAIENLTIPKLLSDRVHYEIHEISKTEKKEIAIIGAGDAAFDYAINLSRNNKIHIFARGTEKKCLPLLEKRVADNKNIEFHGSTRIKSISETDDGKIILLLDSHSDKAPSVYDYLIIAVGRNPQNGLFSNKLLQKKDGLIKSGLLYFAGDIKNGRYRQTAIACGDGLKAAMKAYEKIREMTR